MAWQHLNLRTFGSMVFQHGLMIPKMNNVPVDEVKLARFKKGLDLCLDEMTTIWLKDTPFIAGNEITIADLLAVTELEQPGERLSLSECKKSQ
jgi:glutathione S-transferase